MDKKLAFQIRSLRGESSQGEIEKISGIKQQALSRLESPSYGKPTLTTLKKLAAAYDVGLLVEFVPFSQLVNRVSGTPYIEHGFSPETMNVPSFAEEERLDAFTPKDDITSLLDQENPQLGYSPNCDYFTQQNGFAPVQSFDSSINQGKKPPLPFRPSDEMRGLEPQEKIRMGGGPQ